jgi:alpha-amylase/alpha-mannosidase (GH57 family)
MRMDCFVCIHCHFYQPPRENAWLEAVESQGSASPYHDWNERITAECYLPNGASRILDSEHRISKIVNNYARISFNFGPTLLSWMEDRAPQAYEQILHADRDSQQRFSGHGSALAQAYNHIILPLANQRDKHTQILWGMRDFQHRFRRDPEGMWLPETAVDVDTLEELSACGIKFTILAPHQAGKMRADSGGQWINLYGQGIDSRRPYICHLPSGRSIALFFYDGAVSRAVAFEKLLFDGKNFAHRLLGHFDPEGEPAQLLHIATDGESYGHHHAHGDMALAFALDYIEDNQLARLTNYGEYLAQHPPAQEVEVVERTSWSCMHGVSRWQANCGCNGGANGSWNQEWRLPLRQALDWLRDELALEYEHAARELLRDPWQPRDEYITAITDRSQADLFLSQQSTRILSSEEKERALRLLEMQRHLLLMYTSCGWFFDEPTGPETVQILQYAARAVQLSEGLFGPGREEQFLQRLDSVRSNLHEYSNGRHIYEHLVRPSMLDLVGVAAHYVISSFFDGYHGRSSVYCYDARLQDARSFERGGAKLAIGHAVIVSRITCAELKFAFAALHFGDHQLTAGIRPWDLANGALPFLEPISQCFSDGDLDQCGRFISQFFRGSMYSLKSLFRDERQRIVSQIVNSTLTDIDSIYSEVYEQRAPLIGFLSEVHVPLPPILRVSAEFVLGNAIQRNLQGEEPDFDYIQMLLDTARRAGISLPVANVQLALRQALDANLDLWLEQPNNVELVLRLETLVRIAQAASLNVDLWRAQTIYFSFLRQYQLRDKTLPTGVWINHFRSLGECLGMNVSSLPLPAATHDELPAMAGSRVAEYPGTNLLAERIC